MLTKLSTTRNLMILMVDSSDHITGKTGLTLTITASKDGGAFSSITPTVTDLGSGWYKLALTTTHTNTLGFLALHVTGTGADPTDISIMVVTDLPGDSVSSVTGAVGSVTGAVGSVTGAVGSVTGAVGSVTGNVGGNVVGSVGSIATNGITSTSIATDAINAASVKADAVTKIQTGLATPTNITAGTITTVTNLTNAPTNGDLTATMKTSVTTAATAATPTVSGVTNPVTVGTINANVITASSIAADAIGASELATDAVTEIAGGVWNSVRSTYTANGSMGESMNQNLTWPVNAANASYVDILGNSVDVRLGDIMVCVAGTGVGTSDIVKKIQTHASPNGAYVYPYGGASYFDTSSRFFFKKAGEVQNVLRVAVSGSISYTTSGNTLTNSGIAGSYSDNAFIGCLLEDRQYAGGTDLLGIYNIVSYDGASGTFTLDRDATNISGQVSIWWIGSFGMLNFPTPVVSSIPTVSAKFKDALAWLFTLGRNKRTQTATTETVYKDDGTTPIGTSTKSDDGTTFTRGKYS